MKFKIITLIPLILTALNAEVQELNYSSDAGGNLIGVTPAYPLVATTPSASISFSVEGAVVSLEVTTSGYGNGVAPNYYEWDFDSDGEVDARTLEASISYSYPTAGTHLAKLYVVDSRDESREYEQSVITTVDMALSYGLNGMEISDTKIIAKIKDTVTGLEKVKSELDVLVSYDGNKLKQEFDTIKKSLDKAKKFLDAVKQSIDNSSEDKNALKAEADKIKKSIDAIKKLIDGYKKEDDNSVEAIDNLKSAIDDVIAMMVSGNSNTEKNFIEVPKGRSVISGNIDATKLPSEIYAVWIVDGGNWYGYSPKQSVREAIKAKYRLIDKIIPAYKAVIVWADEDASIELEDDNSIDNVTQSYGKNFTIHGTNNQTVDADDIVCSDSKNAITGLFKVSGDEPSVFVPNRQIDGVDNFYYIYGDEGYYVLCEKKQGGV